MSTNLFDFILIGVALSLIVWRGAHVARVGLDARQRGFRPIEIGRWALVAVIDANRYWWGARLDRLTASEALELLATAAQTLGLLSVANVRCPLCDAEIKHVFSVTANGELYVHRQAKCTQCDFRVDACRHCAHFLPAGATMFEQRGDFSHGRCGFYRASEPVRTAYPQHAQRLEALGYDALPTPRAIVDSYVPLDECTAFSLNLKHLRANRVPRLGRDRIALIRLEQRLTQSLRTIGK